VAGARPTQGSRVPLLRRRAILGPRPRRLGRGAALPAHAVPARRPPGPPAAPRLSDLPPAGADPRAARRRPARLRGRSRLPGPADLLLPSSRSSRATLPPTPRRVRPEAALRLPEERAFPPAAALPPARASAAARGCV
jgi:hypothetical protein